VVLVPELTSPTVEARAVLPPAVPLQDAVFNLQRVALLLASVLADRPDALARALEDRLHEPFRRRLFPWMVSVAAAAREAGALGCVLSGAGPSLLAVVEGDGRVASVARAMERALQGAGVRGVARHLPVDRCGAVVDVAG
jgi:homoserine kinase